jgi:hypothetical protein
MLMDADWTEGRRCSTDPDPVVLDLLVNVAATAIGGYLLKLLSEESNRRRSMWGPHRPSIQPDTATLLLKWIDELDSLIAEAIALVPADVQRTLGVPLLLTPEQLRRYSGIRDHIFELVRTLQDFTQRLPIESDGQLEGQQPLPKGMQRQCRAIQRELKDARTAALSAEAFARIRSAAQIMRRLVESESALP